ncbi:hypothetical protein ACSBR2_019889 [Camellia fascicularis]
MEILSRILTEKAAHPDFEFHWRCDKTKIVNLCFADDLMIFCKGDVFTVQSIKIGLEEFKNLSGLSLRPNKSHIFFSGCDKKLRDEILRVCNFNEGTFPMRYLGVPLVSTKLKATDCDQLVERITKRIKSWTNKCLTYAGRAQLIESVLFSMQVYWTTLFILPKKVIKSIESLFRAFFWVGDGSRVSLWFDNWHPMGSLWDRFGVRIVYDSALGINAKVGEIVEGTTWRWPFPSSWELMDHIDSTPSTFLPTGGSNDVSWCPAANGQFTIQSTWNFLRQHFDQVNWSKIIWGPHNIPKHPCEDHNHPFFECPFSERVWTYIKGKINVDWPSIQWNDLIRLIAKSVKGKSLGAVITKLAFTCTMYQLWIVRNNRVFSKDMVPEEMVSKLMEATSYHVEACCSWNEECNWTTGKQIFECVPYTMRVEYSVRHKQVYGAVFPE